MHSVRQRERLLMRWEVSRRTVQAEVHVLLLRVETCFRSYFHVRSRTERFAVGQTLVAACAIKLKHKASLPDSKRNRGCA